MTLTSNIRTVIGQIEGLKERIPAAVAAALRPEKWIDLAVDVATRTLSGLAEGDEVLWIPSFIISVRALVLSGEMGFMLTMEPRLPLTFAGKPVEGAQEVAKGGMELFAGQVKEMELAILEWVQTPEEEGGKKRDSRDSGKSDEEIADFISWIMLAPNPGDVALGARARLLPHIAEFVARKQSGNLPPAVMDLWLRTVLEAWRAMVMAQLTKRIRAELRAKKFP